MAIPKDVKLAKVQVTSNFSNWWESDLSTIFFDEQESVRIVGAVVEGGGLYLIYTYINLNRKQE